MPAVPVLLITHDDVLCRHWLGLDEAAWRPARATALCHLADWRDAGGTLAVLDAGMPGLPAWRDPAMAAAFQGVDVVAASMRPNDEEGKEALAAGAKGYIHAYVTTTALDTVLKTVQAGNVWLGPTLLARLLRQIDERVPRTNDWAAGLTLREKEVAERVAIGHSNQAIADELGISERTVRAHVSATFEKLGVTDRLMLSLKVHGVTGKEHRP